MKSTKFLWAIFTLVLAAAVLGTVLAAPQPGKVDFKAKDGIWLDNNKPFYSTTAHAVFHLFRKDRAKAIEDLQNMKKAGFTIVETYWQWRDDLDPKTNEYSFEVFDDFALECKKVGLKTFCMFQEYAPAWLGEKYGWSHTSEEGNKDFRVDDFYVCNPTFVQESKRFYTSLIEHLKVTPEVSENILYWNMGGEYKPFRPHRQPKNLEYGYDDFTVKAFRKWLAGKGWSPASVARRWGAPDGTYKSWEDVWPAINMMETDYKGTALSKIGAARWDWYDFRQEVSWKHMADAISWVRAAGDTRPMIHEYNIITPGGIAPMLRWSRVGARNGKDGIHHASGTFDREFDYDSLLYNLAICKGASIAPWQSNEQKGNTAPEWMRKHAWLLIGWGGTGMHFWDWSGDGWGVVNPDRTPSEGYPSAVRLNSEYEFYGDILKSSKPMPNRIGILALAEESFYLPFGHTREMQSFLRTLLENGSGMEVSVITDDEVLDTDMSEYKVIVSPGQEHMRQSVREKLAKFVKKGGTLWLMSNSAAKNELDEANTANPGAPLDQAAGLKVTGSIDPVIDKLATGRKTSNAPAPFGMLEKTVANTTAAAIGFIKTKPAIFRNTYGKGYCYYQAAATAYPPGENTPLMSDPEGLKYYVKSNCGQPPVDLLDKVLTEQGIDPYVRIVDDKGNPITSVIVGIRKAEPGYLLILVEAGNYSTSAKVVLNAKRLGINETCVAYSPKTLQQYRMTQDEGYSFRTTFEPSEVKVLHLVSAFDLADGLALYGNKNWGMIEKSLPAIPEKQLIPPSEIGKVDPGDLKNIKPEPYKDNWLLLDISKHVNRSLVDEGKMENAKAFLGSVGVGDNDLSELPSGTQEFVGVPFKILDPKVSKNSCMITKTNGRPWLGPLEFKDIPVRSQVKKAHWLYGTGWAPFDLPVGYITYHYSDGTKAQENIICGKNVMNWWGRAEQYENDKLQLAWSGNTPASKRNYTTVGLYHYAWDNPYPAKTVESIDITSYGGDACLITVAITGEK